MKKEILTILKLRLESSSFILLPNIYKSEYNHLKLLWLILTILSTGWCAWFMSRSFVDYFSYDVITKTEVKYESLLIFPVITFCSLNTFNTNYANDYINNLFNSSEPNFTDGFLANYLVNYNITKNLTDKYLFGKRIDELIVNCRFGMNECNLTQDFESYYDFNYGNCFRFNSGKNMNGQKIEKKYATALFGSLDLQFWTGSAQNNYNLLSIDNGLVIFISNETVNSAFTNGINISPGYTTKISLDKLTIIKKPKPYSYCVGNLNFIDSYDSLTYKKLFMVKQGQAYNYRMCYIFCLQRHLGDICQCQLDYLGLTYYNEMRLCLINESLRNQDFRCFSNTLNLILKDSQPFLKICDCPIECEYYFYKYSSSFAEFPSRKYLPYLINAKLIKSIFNNSLNDSLDTFDILRKSIARIQIQYEDMMQTFITEYPKIQSADLVSSVGGIFGLFLGLSFLSFIEIFDLLFRFLYTFMKKTKINKVSINNSKS